MFLRLLVPALALAMVGCIPTSKCNKEMQESTDSCCAAPTEGTACCAEGSSCCSTTEAVVELKTVKYDQLTEAVRAHKGKVVVMDVWASVCEPCKKEFPRLLELHRRYGPDGVVCLSVSVDQPKDAGEALAFLQNQKATFPNYRLEEEVSYWQDKWNIGTIPAVFVFDRDGQRVGKFTREDPENQFTYEGDVEPLVRKLLKAK